MTDKYDAAASVELLSVPPRRRSNNPYRVANDARRSGDPSVKSFENDRPFQRTHLLKGRIQNLTFGAASTGSHVFIENRSRYGAGLVGHRPCPDRCRTVWLATWLVAV